MRITIDTEELARSGATGAAPSELPMVDAGAAPIEHIRRMIGVRAAGVDAAAFVALGAGNGLDAGMRAAVEPALNPLRAGAPTNVATSDGGRAAHPLGGDATASDAAVPVPTPRPKAKARRKT